MKINTDKIFWMIKQSEYLEEDDRHTEAFCSGVKTAHAGLKCQLEDYIKSKLKGEKSK